MVTKMELFEWKKGKVTRKNKLFAVNTILILLVHDKYRSVKFVTFRNNCSKISLSTSMHLATREWTTPFVHLSWSSRFFMRAATSKCERAIHVVYPSFFCNLYSSSHPTNKNLKEVQTAHFNKHSDLGTCTCKHFYHNARYYNTLYPNINFSSWIILYNASINSLDLFNIHVLHIFIRAKCYLRLK
jgi:hypothetical protein